MGYDWNDLGVEISDEDLKISAKTLIAEQTYELPASAKKYELIEPYFIDSPYEGPLPVYHNAYFDPDEGILYAIESNLPFDNGYFDENGTWIYTSDPPLEIPSEIDGIPVKKVASYINRYIKLDYFYTIIIPDGIELDEHAFDNIYTEEIKIGNNVIAGYDSLPNYDKITYGDNFIYKGDTIKGGGGTRQKYIIDETFNGAYLYYDNNDVITHPEEVTSLYFGCGNNIIDKYPNGTLEIGANIRWVDPRLNRLNRKFVVDENNPYYSSKDGILYNKDMTKLISVPISVKSIDIPSTVTEIGDYALSYCNEIKQIFIPASIKSIGYRAFWHLSNIEQITFMGSIPDNFEAISCKKHQVREFKNNQNIRIKYTIDNEYINIQSSGGGQIYWAFYNENGTVIEASRGYTRQIKIPPLAAKYELYSFGYSNSIAPVCFNEYGYL